SVLAGMVDGWRFGLANKFAPGWPSEPRSPPARTWGEPHYPRLRGGRLVNLLLTRASVPVSWRSLPRSNFLWALTGLSCVSFLIFSLPLSGMNDTPFRSPGRLLRFYPRRVLSCTGRAYLIPPDQTDFKSILYRRYRRVRGYAARAEPAG